MIGLHASLKALGLARKLASSYFPREPAGYLAAPSRLPPLVPSLTPRACARGNLRESLRAVLDGK